MYQKLFAASVKLDPLPHATAGKDQLQLILSIVFGVVGALSLLMITIAGFRYVISNGDPQKVAQAKNAIIYSVIGLMVAIAAEAIVTFVLGNL